MELTIEMAGGQAEAWFARPSHTTKAVPGVLLFMDAIGLRPQIRQMAETIAEWGYAVLSPNVFYRSGSAAETSPTSDLRLPGERERYFSLVGPRMAELTSHRSRADTAVFLSTLKELPGVCSHAPVGVVGYCMGVRLAMRAAGDHPKDVGAVAGFHGGGLVVEDADSPHRSLATARASFLLRHADEDQTMPPVAMQVLADAATQSALHFDQDVYLGAAHGFSMADTSMYDDAAAERHFDDLRRHFDDTIGLDRLASAD